MNENNFWATLWAIIATVIITITISISSYYKHADGLIAEMVLAGANPVAASCALNDSYGKNPVCVIYSVK